MQRLYLSDTGITGKAVRQIARYAQDLLSLSLVGCAVDLLSLMQLGDPAHRCARSLQDLHLSSSQYSAFYCASQIQCDGDREVLKAILQSSLPSQVGDAESSMVDEDSLLRTGKHPTMIASLSCYIETCWMYRCILFASQEAHLFGSRERRP
jgi:hypothetical protein